MLFKRYIIQNFELHPRYLNLLLDMLDLFQ